MLSEAATELGRKVPIDEGSGVTDEITPYIPSRYNSESKLRVQVVPGKVNVHDFRLTGSQPNR